MGQKPQASEMTQLPLQGKGGTGKCSPTWQQSSQWPRSFIALETSQPWLSASTGHMGLVAGVHSSELRAWANKSLPDHPITHPHFPGGEIGPAGSCQGQYLTLAPLEGQALLGGGSQTWQGDSELPTRPLYSRCLPDPPRIWQPDTPT